MPMSQAFQDRLLSILSKAIEKFGTPFHFYDEIGIRRTLQDLNAGFTQNGVNFQEYYAVKALPRQAIVNIVKEEHGGFDCSSIPELRLARNAGAAPQDIMFTSNNTSMEEFEEALAFGGCILNLDGIEYIEKVKRLGPFPELICFRLHPGLNGSDDQTAGDIRRMASPDSKYGVPVERIVEAFILARKAGAKRFGLHTMVCSNDRDYTHMVETLKTLLCIGALLKEEGIQLEFLNGGGGLGIPYRLTDKPFDASAFAAACSDLLKKFEVSVGYKPKICIESGRLITGPHGVLVNRVINRYKKYQEFAGVEVAMPANMRVAIYSSAYHHCTLLDSHCRPIPEGSRPLIPITVAGSICENCDVLGKQILMPDPREGDIMLTQDDGAHTAAMAFNYNGRPRPQELLHTVNGNVKRIWRAENYDDLARRGQGLDGPEHVLMP